MSAEPTETPEAAENAEAVLARAAARGRAAGLPYAGAVTPREAWFLQRAGAAVIVDVRTKPEWEFVGRYPESAHLEWRAYGQSVPDPSFAAKLAARFPSSQVLLFLCRSAVRSHHAAEVAAKSGFAAAYNILEGFEGDLGPDGRRGHAGWRKAGLPWTQG